MKPNFTSTFKNEMVFFNFFKVLFEFIFKILRKTFSNCCLQVFGSNQDTNPSWRTCCARTRIFLFWIRNNNNSTVGVLLFSSFPQLRDDYRRNPSYRCLLSDRLHRPLPPPPRHCWPPRPRLCRPAQPPGRPRPHWPGCPPPSRGSSSTHIWDHGPGRTPTHT